MRLVASRRPTLRTPCVGCLGFGVVESASSPPISRTHALPTVTDELWDRIQPLLPVGPRRFRYPGRKPLDAGRSPGAAAVGFQGAGRSLHKRRCHSGLSWLKNGCAVLPAPDREWLHRGLQTPKVGLPSWFPCWSSRRRPMPVMIGVDPHKASHTAAALDEHGQLLARQRVPATLEGLPDPAYVGCTMAGPALGGRGCPRHRPGAGPATGQRRRTGPGRASQAGRPGTSPSVGHGRKNDPDDAVSVAVAAHSVPQLRRGRRRGPSNGAAPADQTPPGPGRRPHPDHQPAAPAADGPDPRRRQTQPHRQARCCTARWGHARWCAGGHPLAARHRARG